MMKNERDLQKMKILAVDDEESALKLYTSLLKEDGYDVATAQTGTQALAQIEKEHFDLVILDLRLPDVHGTELLKEIRERAEDLSIIIVTANPSLESSMEAVRAGVYDYIIKPFSSKDLKMVVQRAIEKVRLTVENKRLLKKLEKTNAALTERVDELERFAKIATGYEETITELKGRMKELEEKQKRKK